MSFRDVYNGETCSSDTDHQRIKDYRRLISKYFSRLAMFDFDLLSIQMTLMPVGIYGALCRL